MEWGFLGAHNEFINSPLTLTRRYLFCKTYSGPSRCCIIAVLECTPVQRLVECNMATCLGSSLRTTVSNTSFLWYTHLYYRFLRWLICSKTFHVEPCRMVYITDKSCIGHFWRSIFKVKLDLIYPQLRVLLSTITFDGNSSIVSVN